MPAKRVRYHNLLAAAHPFYGMSLKSIVIRIVISTACPFLFIYLQHNA